MTCKVITVTHTPAQFISMIGGVPTTKRAEIWGEKQGFAVVAYHKRLQRAYGITKAEGK